MVDRSCLLSSGVELSHGKMVMKIFDAVCYLRAVSCGRIANFCLRRSGVKALSKEFIFSHVVIYIISSKQKVVRSSDVAATGPSLPKL